MPDTNGHQDGESRLDRLERAMDFIIAEHESFREEHKFLLRAQVVFQDHLDKLALRVDEIGGKLDALIDVVDRDHREFNERFKRLNG